VFRVAKTDCGPHC